MLSPKVSLTEIEIFLEVGRLRSLKEAGRRLSLRTSSLSKLITKMERALGTKLFVRSVKGMELTPEGLRFYGSAKKIVGLLPEMNFNKSAKTKTPQRTLYTVGSISFLCSKMIAPSIAKIVDRTHPLRLRIVEFDNNQLVHYGIRGAFDIAVHLGPLEWTKAWHSTEVAEIRWGLFGRYGHPLGTQCTQSQALEYPFVVPTGWSEIDGFIPGSDNCPVPVDQRSAGHEATTADTASQIIQHTDELTFIPEICVRSLASKRLVQEISVSDWEATTKMIHLSVRSDRVSKKLFEKMRHSFRQELKEQ